MAAPRWIRTQLAGPTGWLARPMALLLNRGNRGEYAHALSRLEIDRGDPVLELGFGGGVGLPMLLERGARVTAVEPTVDMRVRAIRKHAWDLAEGRLEVLDGRAEDLPEGPFRHALSLNTVYFWDDVPAGMAELRRAVRDTLCLGIASPDHLERMGFAESGFRIEPVDWYLEQLRTAGFPDLAVEPIPGSASSLVLARG